jgi:hypothetical protein
MVDREARNQTAVLLRHLAIGRITAKQFDAALESMTFSGQDHIFEAIFEETFSIKSTTRHEVARWILFLQSENEYIWPGIDELPNPFSIILGALVAVVLIDVFHNPVLGWWLTVAGYIIIIGAASRLRPKRYKPGDLKVWPFHKHDDFEEAKRCPRLLNGKQ